MPWRTSTRAKRLPANWGDLKRQVKARANGRCEAEAHDPRCDGRGAECDHITQGDNHALSNLQWLSTPCHDAKTRAENAARNRATAALKRRPTEPHPGRRHD